MQKESLTKKNNKTEASIKFKANTNNRADSVIILIPHINKDSTTEEIEALLGLPDEVFWNYTIFYSSILTVYFNQESRVKEVFPCGL